MIRLAVPAALWLLALLPVIVLLYMLRARRQEVPISSVLLWQRARRDLAMQLPIRRLERNVLLLLQLLAASLAILALARPQLIRPAATSTATVLVMDTSASMQATDVRPSRFEAARSEALTFLAQPGGPVMIVESGALPRVVTPFTDRPAARAPLIQLQPSDGPARLETAVTLAVAQRLESAGQAPQGKPEVIVFTDRAGASAPGITYRVIGRSSRNVGLTGIHTTPTTAATHAVIQVSNAGDVAETTNLEVFLNDRRVASRALRLAPGSVTAVPLDVTGEGILRAQIDLRDQLAADNTAHAMVGTPPPRVVVVGAPDPILEEALDALPVRVVAGRVTQETLDAADVVVLNRTPATELPPGNYLLLGTTASNLPLSVHGVARAPQVLRWTSSHPVMRYVEIGNVQIGEALALRPRGGEVLAEGEVPLIWAVEGDGLRAVVVAFALHQSDLPLQVAFPIFLHNALTWLGRLDQTYQAGQSLIVPARGESEALLTGPAGVRRSVPSVAGSFVIPSIDRAGIYTLRAGRREMRFAVNTASEETQIVPRVPVGPAGTAAPAGGLRERGVELWRPLLLLALVVLVAEWLLWLRELPRVEYRGGHPRHPHGGSAVRTSTRPAQAGVGHR